MFNRTKLFTLLFVATATYVFLDSIHVAFTKSIDEVSPAEVLKSYYEDAKAYVETIISQIQFERPYYPIYWNRYITPTSKWSFTKVPSGECYEFLRQHAERNKTQAIECSRTYLMLANRRRKQLDAITREMFDRLSREYNTIPRCESDLENSVIPSTCDDKFEIKIKAIVEENIKNMTVVVNKATNVLSKWVTETGRCLINRNNFAEVRLYYTSCKYSIKRSRQTKVKKPTIS